MLVMRCGWKPPWHIAVKAQEAIDHLWHLRRMDDAERGFSMPGGGVRKCSLHRRRMLRASQWADGRASGPSPGAKQLRKAHRKAVRDQAVQYVRDKTSVRGIRKKGQL